MSKSDPRPATSHITPFGLRMQPELKERLEKAASESGRSLNAEISARLEASFANEGGLTDFDKKFLLHVVHQMRQANGRNAQLDLLPSEQQELDIREPKLPNSQSELPAKATHTNPQLTVGDNAALPAERPAKRHPPRKKSAE